MSETPGAAQALLSELEQDERIVLVTPSSRRYFPTVEEDTLREGIINFLGLSPIQDLTLDELGTLVGHYMFDPSSYYMWFTEHRVFDHQAILEGLLTEEVGTVLGSHFDRISDYTDMMEGVLRDRAVQMTEWVNSIHDFAKTYALDLNAAIETAKEGLDFY